MKNIINKTTRVCVHMCMKLLLFKKMIYDIDPKNIHPKGQIYNKISEQANHIYK